MTPPEAEDLGERDGKNSLNEYLNEKARNVAFFCHSQLKIEKTFLL